MRRRFAHIGIAVVVLALSIRGFAQESLAQGSAAQGREEFIGPLKGWANVRHGFGAKGNGKDDDTHALQTAIDLLSVPPKSFGMGAGAYTVVYLPAGVYCISAPLRLRGKIGVSILGEDPARTIIKWTGKDSGSMFLADGSAYFRVSRFTWDANGRKGIEGLGIHWRHQWNDAQSQSFAALNIELSDNWFIGGFRLGISGGTTPQTGTGNNDSEITIRRCRFDHCATGIGIIGFNALDYWIWDSRFLQCGKGVDCAYGNYHLYGCYFSGSAVSDVHNNNGYYNSLRGCLSVNANDCSSDEGGSSNPFKRIFQDDTIVNPVHVPIRHNHLGKLTLLGNAITANTGSDSNLSVYNRSWYDCTYEALSLHNSYAYADAVKLDRDPHKLYSFADRVDRNWRVDTAGFLTRMDRTPPRVERRVFEIPAGAGSMIIQAALDSAAALKGHRPVVHFRMGTYYITRPLTIPAGCDMQLIGDGWVYNTVIRPADIAAFHRVPLLVVEGPSFISIRDIHFGDAGLKGEWAGILFKNVDQPQAQVHIDQLYSPAADTSLYVGDLNHLYVEKDNSFFSAGNYISGGNLVRQGRGTSRVCCYGGQFAHLWVENNGRFVAKDCWWEGADKTPLDLSGWGSVTIDGAMIAPYKQDSTTTVNIGKFRGSVSLMNMYLQGALLPRSDNPGLNLLVWNIHFYHKMNVLAFLEKGATYKAAFLGLNAQCFRANDPECRLISCINDRLQNVGDIGRFLDMETAATRESQPVPLTELPAGASNIHLSRVSFGVMNRGVSFAP
ncbi:glycosyl hydrolase family 28-related protein [Puia sp.]|jgi:hypothetical protein|uniref:glycosyl hydrolase family 28-related protein n=1 Tax=Puia sp. TaxID=2045100 RepID=UPI002F42DA74